MFTVFIPHVCKSNENTKKIVSLLTGSSRVDKIIIIDNEPHKKEDIKSGDAETVYCTSPFCLAESLKSFLPLTESEFVAVIPDCFVFSKSLLDLVSGALSEDPHSLYVFNKENNVVVNDRSNATEEYRIYKMYDQSPSVLDIENCFFLKKDILLDFIEKGADFLIKLKSHFFVKYLAGKFKESLSKVVFPVNERFFFDNDFSGDCSMDFKSDKTIAEDNGIIPKLKLSFLQKIFSVTDFDRHKVISLLGFSVRVKFKKKVSFPSDCTEFENTKDISEYKHRRACIFAGFTAKGEISDNSLSYLRSIRKHVDYLVYVADSKATKNTIEKLNDICDAVVIRRHCEYDFGSYKIAFGILDRKGILGNIDSLLFCNDSVDFVGNDSDLSSIFEKAADYDAYAMCMATYGFGRKIRRHKYEWTKNPHLQSYFLIVSDKVFRDSQFKDFIYSIKKLRSKTEIIKKYEMGLTEFFRTKDYKIGSYYPYDDTNIVNPYAIYLNEYVEHPILTKHMLKK